MCTSIDIIEVAYAAGDNPCVSNGVSLSIEWEAKKRITIRQDPSRDWRGREQGTEGTLQIFNWRNRKLPRIRRRSLFAEDLLRLDERIWPMCRQ
jgi:hypothetical protein